MPPDPAREPEGVERAGLYLSVALVVVGLVMLLPGVANLESAVRTDSFPLVSTVGSVLAGIGVCGYVLVETSVYDGSLREEWLLIVVAGCLLFVPAHRVVGVGPAVVGAAGTAMLATLVNAELERRR